MVDFEKMRRSDVHVSPSQSAHFATVVPHMDSIGATRHGSNNVRTSGGWVLVDIYTLPAGNRIMAGYPNLELNARENFRGPQSGTVKVRRSLLRRVFNLSLLVLILGVGAVGFYLHSSIDGLSGAFALFGEEQTEYSKGYSDDRFDEVTLGVEANEVKELLGEPLDKISRNGAEVWLYTRSAEGADYRVREIAFSEETPGVASKAAYFHRGE